MQFRVVERYVLGCPLASGGMATVHLGRALSLPRIVAIKQLKPELAADRSFIRMFADEVQLLARVRHKNVIAPIEYIELGSEFFIVMEYIEGCALSDLSPGTRLPLPIASKIIGDVLLGLHAAHDSVDPNGQPLGLIHRDVSPQNVLVGRDGDARVVDFGIAKAAWRAEFTEHGQLKGKPNYMAPEQLAFEHVDRRADLFSAGVLLWELLTGNRLFADGARACAVPNTSAPRVSPPGSLVPGVPAALDDFVLRCLARNPDARFPDAKSMAEALSAIVAPASSADLGHWLAQIACDELERRSQLVKEFEAESLEVRVSPERTPHSLPAHPSAASSAPREGEGFLSTVTRPITRLPAPPLTRHVAAAAVAIGIAFVALGVHLTSNAPASAHGAKSALRPQVHAALPSPPPTLFWAPASNGPVERAPVASPAVSAPAAVTQRSGAATSPSIRPHSKKPNRAPAVEPPPVREASSNSEPARTIPEAERDSLALPTPSVVTTGSAPPPAAAPASAAFPSHTYSPVLDGRRE